MDLPGIVTHKIPLERGKQKTGQREAHTEAGVLIPRTTGGLSMVWRVQREISTGHRRRCDAFVWGGGQKSAGSGPLMPSWGGGPPSIPAGRQGQASLGTDVQREAPASFCTECHNSMSSAFPA